MLDGAMGTMIQKFKLTESQYRGERFKDWPSDIKFVDQFFHFIISHANAITVEGIGFNNVRTSLEILLVDFFNDLRLGQGEEIIIAFNITGPIFKAFAAVLAFGQLMLLDHRSHGPIEKEDPDPKKIA